MFLWQEIHKSQSWYWYTGLQGCQSVFELLKYSQTEDEYKNIIIKEQRLRISGDSSWRTSFLLDSWLINTVRCEKYVPYKVHPAKYGTVRGTIWVFNIEFSLSMYNKLNMAIHSKQIFQLKYAKLSIVLKIIEN